MPQPQILLGSFVSTGAPRNLEIPFAYVGANIKIELVNRTNFASSANPGVVKRSWWQTGMADASWLGVQNTNGAATDQSTGSATVGGFTLIDTNQTNQLEAALVGTAITAATPAVATDAGHPYVVGDIVRVTNSTGMLQVSGYDFSITAVAGNDFTFGYLPAVGFAAAATALTTRRLRYQDIYAPRNRFITAITQAAQAVVTLSVTHGYVVGQIVRFHVESKYGMVQIDGLQGEITAISTANNTITVDINSTGFTAFAFPTSASYALGATPAHISPVGEDQILEGATKNEGFAAIHLGASVAGALNDVVDYRVELGY